MAENMTGSGLGCNIFILWKGSKTLGSAGKTRVGRVTGNTTFFLLGLSHFRLFSTTCFHLPSTVTTARYSFAIQLVAG